MHTLSSIFKRVAQLCCSRNKVVGGNQSSTAKNGICFKSLNPVCYYSTTRNPYFIKSEEIIFSFVNPLNTAFLLFVGFLTLKKWFSLNSDWIDSLFLMSEYSSNI
jgi:hypothetical protein